MVVLSILLPSLLSSVTGAVRVKTSEKLLGASLVASEDVFGMGNPSGHTSSERKSVNNDVRHGG